MKRLFYIVLVCLLILTFSGCQTATQRRNTQVAIGIHAVHDSLKAKRIDLANKYSDELVKIVPKPKKAVIIKSVEFKQVDGVKSKFIVLPKEDKDLETLVVGSEKYQDLLKNNKELQDQLAAENKKFEKFEVENSKVLEATYRELESARKSSSFWSFFGITGITGIVGIVVLCVFFPALIPIFVNIFGMLVGAINNILGMIGRLFKQKE